MSKSITITIATTKRGLPAVWESGGGLTSSGKATIVAKPDGSKPRAVYVRRGGHLACGDHALVAVHKGYYLVHCRVSRGARSGGHIERIVETSVKDINGERFEATATVEVVNTFSEGSWDHPLDAKLEAAVKAAFGKASTYHNRSAWYIDTSERPAETPEQRKRREAEMAKQDAERARLRAEKAAADAKAKAEAEAASRAALPALMPRLSALVDRIVVLRAVDPNTSYSELQLGDSRFSFGWGLKDALYTDANLAAAERMVSGWEEQAAEKLRKQKARAEFQPQFEAFGTRVEALGLSLSFGEEKVNWEGGSYYGGFAYGQEGLAAFEADIVHKEEEADKAARERAAADAKAKAEAGAAELGLPQNIRIWKRTGGATNCGMGWVITPDGVDRERDALENDNPRRAARYDEGYLVWKQILPGELVIAWRKAFTAAPHEFEVVHLPSEGLTEAQLERVAEIQQELEDTWAGRRGLASGLPSPAVGRGWGLGDFETPPALPQVFETSESDSFDDNTEVPAEPADMETALQQLQDKFGRNH